MRGWHGTVKIVAMALLTALGTGRGMAQAEVPFSAFIKGDPVPMYAGAGHTFYVVGQLEGGSAVTVEEVIFGWYKIPSPPGTFSYVEARLIEADPDAKTGVVAERRAAVKAGGLDGPTQSYRRQLDLLKGDRVRILAKQGNYYKILPPRGAYLFLPPGSVRIATTAGSVPSLAVVALPDTAPAPTPTTRADRTSDLLADGATTNQIAAMTSSLSDYAIIDPAAAGGEDVNLPTPDPSTAQPTEPQPKASVVSPSVQRLEHRFRSQMGLPLDQQPIDQLVDEYQTLSDRRNLNTIDRQIIALRLKQLQRQSELRMALNVVTEARMHSAQAGLISTDPDAPIHYVATGTLATSSVYNGQGLPLLYRIIDPRTDRTITYVHPSEKVNMGAFLGKHVGLVGQAAFDQDLQLRVVTAQQIDPLEAQANAGTLMSTQN